MQRGTGWAMWIGWAVIALAALSVSGARAQATVAEPPGYRVTIEEALREYDAGHFEEARSLFGRAHRLFPNARTHRGLGMVEFELRNYMESIPELEASLSVQVKPVTGALRTDTEQLLARAYNFVARVTIESTPAVARVLVNGEPSEVSPGRPLILAVGDHLVELQAPGYLTEKRRLKVRGGESQTLRVVLTRPSASGASASTPSNAAGSGGADSAPSASRRWYRSPWLWSAVGAVIAGGVAGAVLATQDRSSKVASPYQGNSGSAEAP